MSLAVTYVPSHELTERFMQCSISHTGTSLYLLATPQLCSLTLLGHELTAHGLQSRTSDITQ